MSNHECLVIKIKKEPHFNAEKLSVVKVFDYTVVVNSDCWEDGQLAVYIPPESIVDTSRREFSFLKREGRTEEIIKVKKLRGIYSQGCVVPAPDGTNEGDDCSEILNVRHYEPPEYSTAFGDEESGPRYPKYDIENYRKYSKLFIDGEIVNISEKLHGTSTKFMFHQDKVIVGGRNIWQKESEDSVYWKAYRDLPQIEKFCTEHPEYILYGETYGQVKNFEYDSINRRPKFRAFDVRRLDGTYIDNQDFTELMNKYNIPTVPQLGNIPFDRVVIDSMVEGDTTIGKALCREGIVIKPLKERYECELQGRLVLKLINNKYLELS